MPSRPDVITSQSKKFKDRNELGESVMPKRIQLGTHNSTTLTHALHRRRSYEVTDFPDSPRLVMGFQLPKWQRGSVWTLMQKMSFLESAWKGLNLGTYTYNQNFNDLRYDFLLIDGQQRLNAIEEYLDDKFPVYGYYYSELPVIDKRVFSVSTTFACYITETDDEKYLKDYYNLTNFGGTAHKDSERA